MVNTPGPSFLEASAKTARDVGLAVTGFLNAGLDTAEKVKDRIDLFRVRIKDDDPLPKAQKEKSLRALYAENKEAFFTWGAVVIVGAAILFSAMKK